MYSSQTPIDIHCSKLIDWLVQRRHCKKDWGENLASVRRKIRAALLDMPENQEIKQLLIGSKLDYFKSKRIVDILKTTEASSKNIFGYYSSQRMKDWQDVVYSYERDYIYLAELSTDLIREINYEVPGIRKVLNRLNKEIEDVEKERVHLLRKAQQFHSEYQKLAQSYGIKGINIRSELNEQSKSLTGVMDEIVRLAQEIGPDLQHYREYASSTSKQNSENFAPMLHYIINKGNTTVFEWRHGEAPESIEYLEERTSTAGNSNSSEIELVDDEIDFGEDLPSSESSSGFVHVDKSDNGNGNIEEETFIKLEGTESRLDCDSMDKRARGDDAKLVLTFRKSRMQLLNNLYELEAFFQQLLSANNDSRSTSFVAEDSSKVRKYEVDEVNQVIARIRKIMSLLNDERNRILFQIIDSPSFVENVKEKFSRKLKQKVDCTNKADSLSDHLKDLETQARETEIHLKKSIVSAKELQHKVEDSLREVYSGRSINIMGC